MSDMSDPPTLSDPLPPLENISINFFKNMFITGKLWVYSNKQFNPPQHVAPPDFAENTPWTPQKAANCRKL
jgi:hypothetical protein